MGFFSDLFGGKERRLEKERLQREAQERQQAEVARQAAEVSRLEKERQHQADLNRQAKGRGDRSVGSKFTSTPPGNSRPTSYPSTKTEPTGRVHQSNFKIDPRAPKRRDDDDYAGDTMSVLGLSSHQRMYEHAPSVSHHQPVAEDNHRHSCSAPAYDNSSNNSNYDGGSNCSAPDSYTPSE